MSSERPEALLVMDRKTLLAQFGEREMARLRELAALGDPVSSAELSSAGVRRRLAEVEVLITSWGCPPLDAEVMAAAPELRAVLHAAGSVRGHVGEEVFDRQVLVTTAADVNAEPVARYTLAAVLWSGKKVPFLFGRSDSWDGDRQVRMRDEQTVVVVGFSRVGRRVVELLREFDSYRVLVVDPVADPAEITAAGAVPATLEQALPQADVLSLHAPLLPRTRGLIGESELEELPPGAVLINTARGGLVDTAALERACRTRELYAVLDVTDPEPLPADSALHGLSNVVLTPHVAGSLGEETRRMSAAALEELERYVAGRPPRAPVTRRSLEVQA
ncbi:MULTISPECIES: hydroxyacid dehydrogenase [unclassified Actinopolyspora]|uniref:hydroxyacid dehydrogenase n=1 Tax=Actinopolyspora TaxID=1849 RepID=UPI0013F6516E|nr:MULTISPECIES: hydroxyacid dehydrogenase [unclassified Actinopolyspora]NHD19398.1 hydroxyacid dehydrogenase [Actinopolyspora sp. BKK2]NHE78529.1 hydroxyacid dehydrogenase [Actinopolyspora sp. BKK1]